MANNSRSKATHKSAVDQVREAERFAVDLPIVGRVPIPRPEQLAYFGALTALVAFELIDWPVAVVIAAGHVLVQNQHNRVMHEFGEALEDARK